MTGAGTLWPVSGALFLRCRGLKDTALPLHGVRRDLCCAAHPLYAAAAAPLADTWELSASPQHPQQAGRFTPLLLSLSRCCSASVLWHPGAAQQAGRHTPLLRSLSRCCACRCSMASWCSTSAAWQPSSRSPWPTWTPSRPSWCTSRPWCPSMLPPWHEHASGRHRTSSPMPCRGPLRDPCGHVRCAHDLCQDNLPAAALPVAWLRG